MSEQALNGAVELFEGLGIDITTEHTEKTPARFLQMMEEMLVPEEFEFTLFPNEEKLDQMIVVSNIPFYSLCEHHVVPFFGTAHIGYIPGSHIVGLSKLPRLVDYMAKGLNTQERITQRVADELWDKLNKAKVSFDRVSRPKGVACILKARHLCMEMRGVEKPGAYTTTSAMKGVFLNDTNQARAEFLQLVHSGSS